MKMYSVLNTLSKYIYLYESKTLNHTLFCLFLKSSKDFSLTLHGTRKVDSSTGLVYLTIFGFPANIYYLKFNSKNIGKGVKHASS